MDKKLVHTPEGVRDIYGREYTGKLNAQKLIHEKFSLYGYEDIQTPTFEFFDVFSKEIGTTPSRELYKFFDKEGNTLVLRPDFTPSMARCAAERLTVLYKDGTDLSAFTAKAVAAVSAQRKGIGYAILDLADSADALKNELEKLDGVIRVFKF